MRKYLFSFIRYALIYFLGFIAFYLFTYLLGILNGFFSTYLPEYFKVYNPITDRAELDRQNTLIAFFASVISVFLISLITVRDDNFRYELMISKTDGFYTVGRGLSIYFRELLFVDAAVSVVIPMSTYWLTLIKIPNDAPRALLILRDVLSVFAVIHASFTAELGLITGAFAIVLVSLVSRFVSVCHALSYWRAAWLVGSEG